MREVLRGRPHRHVLAPTTRLGTWGAGLAAAAIVLFTALLTVVPGDSLAAELVASSTVALVIAAVFALHGATRHGERATSVWATAVVLAGGILLVLLHSLFISD